MDAVSSLSAQPTTAPRLALRVTPLRLLAVMTFLALAIRLVGIGQRPLWLDEGYSAWFASRPWHELWTVVPTYETHPPFYYSLLKLWRILSGGSAIGLRLFSVVLTATTMPVVFAASAELERFRPSGRPLLRAGIAGFLVGCSPMLVVLGAEARPYPLLILAYSMATLGLLRLFREFGAGGPGGWVSWLMLASGTELAMWAHGLGPLFGLCLGAALAPAWLRSAPRERIVRGLLTASAIALLYLPCALMIMRRAGDWGSGWLGWEPIMMLHLFGLYAIPFEMLTVASSLVALVMILLAKRAVHAGFQGKGWNADRALLLLWWGPPILSILISQLGMPIFLPRTLSPTLIPAYLALAGTVARADSSRERFALTAALGIILLPNAIQVALRPANEPWDQVSAYLQRNVRPADQIWLYPNDSAVPLREAGSTIPGRGIPGDYPAVGFKGPIRAGSPAVVSLTHDQAQAVARDPSVASVPTIWLVTRQIGVFDPRNEVPTALSEVRRPGTAAEWNFITVRPYYRR